MSETSTIETKLLKNLWDEREAATLAATPLELLRYRSNLLGEDLRITNFGGGNTSSKFELPDPLTGEPQRVMAVKGSGGDLRSISARRLRHPVSRQARIADRALSRRGARRRDGRVLPALRLRREPRGRVDRHAAPRVPAVSARRSPAPGLGDRARRQRQRQREAGGVQRSATAAASSGSRGSGPGFELALMLRARSRRNPAATASSSAVTGCSRGATPSATAT